MIAEAIDKLANLNRAAEGVRVVTLPHEPKHRYVLQGPDRWEVVTAEPQPRAGKALDIPTAVAFATDGSPESEIWYSRTGVVTVLDRDTRRDRVTFTLDYSRQMQNLQNWDLHPAKLDQKDLLRVLRNVFADCQQDCVALMGQLQRVKWSTAQDADIEVKVGKTSLGKNLRSEVTNTDGLPEVFTLHVPVFHQRSCSWKMPVDVSLEPIAEDCKFLLTPLAGSVEVAIAAAEALLAEEIGNALDDKVVPVYYGRPE